MAKKPLKVTVKGRKTGKEKVLRSIQMNTNNSLSAGIEKGDRRSNRALKAANARPGADRFDRAFRSGRKATVIKRKRRAADRGPRWPSDG